MEQVRTRGSGEGSVYQDGARAQRQRSETPTGRWVAQVRVDGRYRRTFHLTEAQARRALRTLLRSVDDGRAVTHGRITLGELLATWQTKHLQAQQLSPRTIDTYRWACDLLTAELGTRPLKTLTPDAIEAALDTLARKGRLVDGRRARPLSRETLIKVRSVLAKALSYAERRGIVGRNVARVVELPAAARRTLPGRALTVDQAGQLLDVAAGDRLAALWTLMLMLGLRPGEATGLTWPDINLDRGVAHVRRSLKVHHGTLVLDEQLKTSRARRSLDMPPVLIEALRQHRRHQAAERLAVGPLWSNDWPELTFTTNVGTPIDPANLRRQLAKLTETAGLGRWHPHELRHSAASILSAAGVPLERVADVLGHDGTRMTALVYRHAVSPSVDAAAIMGDVLGRNGA